jgi:integrase
MKILIRWITLPPELTKSNEGRKIPTHPRVLECLTELSRSQYGTTNFLFPDSSKNKPRLFPRTAWEYALKRADIQNFRFHDLRHTLITNSRKAGKQDRSIMKITGHRTMSVFMRYDTVDDEDLLKVIEFLAQSWHSRLF